MSQYNGLAYSETNQGGFCKYCVLFGQAPHLVSKFSGILVTQPLNNLQKASEKLRKHFLGLGSSVPCAYHLVAFEKATNFIATMERKQLPVDEQLSSVMARRIEENCRKLKAAVRAVILCGRQGIALRSHQDDWKHLGERPYDNFVALLQFAIESDDTVLAEHLRSAGRNALYTSKTIQNEFIEICGNIICTTILKQVHAANLAVLSHGRRGYRFSQ